MNLNSNGLILLPLVDSKSNYLTGFWRWVELLASDDYQRSLEGLYWPRGTSWTPEALKSRITTFFGRNETWSVVIPNKRLIGVINDATHYQPKNQKGWGWFMAQIPLTTEPTNPKNDEIPLVGLACSFFVHQYHEHYVLEFEIFHL